MTKRFNLNNKFWSKVDTLNGFATDEDCWLWTGSKDKNGYGLFMSTNTGLVKAHRLIWTVLKGEIPNKFYICHKCDSPSCVNPSHLFIGSPSDNQIDCSSKGRNRTNNVKNIKTGGVHWNQRRCRFEASITRGSKRSFLGYFSTEVKAAEAIKHFTLMYEQNNNKS